MISFSHCDVCRPLSHGRLIKILQWSVTQGNVQRVALLKAWVLGADISSALYDLHYYRYIEVIPK